MTSSADYPTSSLPIIISPDPPDCQSDCQLWFDCTANEWKRCDGLGTWVPLAGTGGAGLHADLTDLATSGHPGTVITIPAGVQGNAVSIAADGSLQDSGVPPGGVGGTTDLSHVPRTDEIEIESSSGQNTIIAAATAAQIGFATAAQIAQLEGTDAAGTARPPTAHAASHATGQADELTPAAIAAATAAQGVLADSAVQPNDPLVDLSSGAASLGQVPKADGVGNIVWQDEAGGVPEAPNDGQYKLRRTQSGVSNWENAGGAALLEVGSSAGTVAAGNAPAVAVANHEAAGNPHGQYPLTSTLGNASTRDVGSLPGDVAQGDAPAAAVAAHEASFNHERVKVTATDTSADYLQNQLQSGDGSVIFSVINPGGNEILDLQATGVGGGQANTGQNVGTGEGLVYKGMSGTILDLRSIKTTASITVATVGDEIQLTGVEEPTNDGNNYARSTSVGDISSWVLLGGAALRNVGSLAGDVAAGNAPAVEVAAHEAAGNPHSQYPLSSSLGDAATRNVGTGAGDVAAGNAPAAAVTAHEGSYPHPSVDQKAALDANASLNAGNAVAGLADITTTHAALVDLATSGHPGSVINVAGIPGNAIRIAADNTLEDAGAPPGGGSGLHADLTDLATSGHPGSAITIGGGVLGNAVSIAADGSLVDSGVPPGGAGGTTDLGHILRAAEIEITSSSGQNTIIAAATAAQIGFATAAQITQLESALQAVIDDTDPYIGGDLKIGGVSNFAAVFTDSLNSERGSAGYTDSPKVGIYLAYAPQGLYSEADGGVLAVPGALEAHGAAFQVESIKHSSVAQEVRCTPEGILFGVDPPPSGWSDSAVDTGSYDLGTGAGVGAWVQLIGTVATVQSDVSAGDRLEIQAYVTAVNKTTNRAGTIEIGFGLDGAAPTVSGDTHSIVGGFSGSLPAAVWSWSTHGGLTAGQTISVWGRRTFGEHSQFGADLVGTTDNHVLEIFVHGAGGGGGSPTDITISHAPTTVTVESSTGTNGVIAQAIAGGDAGVMSGADKTKVDASWADGSTVVDWGLGAQNLGSITGNTQVDLNNGHDFTATMDGLGDWDVDFISTAGHAATHWSFTMDVASRVPVWKFNGAVIDLTEGYDISTGANRYEFFFRRNALGTSVSVIGVQ